MARESTTDDASGDEMPLVVFRLATREFAISILQAEHILPYTPPTRWSEAPGFVEGQVPWAGASVPVMDLRKRLGLPAVLEEDSRIMVIRAGPQLVGAVVDQVVEVLRVDARLIQPAALGPEDPARDLAGGRISRRGRSIVILNAARLLSAAERQALTEALP